MANIFGNAAVDEKAVDTKKKKGGLQERTIGESLDNLAAVDALIKTLGTYRDTFYADVTNEMIAQFVKEAMDTKKRPANFKGTGKYAEAQCELKKRSVRRVLSPEETNTLKRYNVNFEHVVITPGSPEKYYFNPQIVADNKLAEKISKALSAIPELKGLQVLMLQPAVEQVEADVVTEQSFDDVAKINDGVIITQLLDIIADTSIKPKLNTDDMEVVMGLIKKAGIKLGTEKKSK